ncbi:MAG: hypothetical protein WCV72_05325 [Patescibacteria group bacterium]
MPPKTNNKLRRSRPAVRFTVRRIANKNPHNARALRQFRRKLTRITAGLIVFGICVSGVFLVGKKLSSDILDANNEINSTCAAIELNTNFHKLTKQMAELSREFPELIENLNFCGEGSCAAEDQAYANENKIWQLEKNFTILKTSYERSLQEFTTELAQKEDDLLFCASGTSCQAAEDALSTARACEKEFKTSTLLFGTRTNVENEYSVVTDKGKRDSAITYVKKIMQDIFKNQDRATKNKTDYAKCVQARDASVCQKYLQNSNDSEEKITSAIIELGRLQIDIQDTLKVLEKDIIALEIGHTDAENFQANEGLGWCTQELYDKKNVLLTKITSSTTQKLLYELALKDLSARKVTLQAGLQSELEIAAMHAAAEKSAAEQALADAAAAAASAIKRVQAEIIFGFWTSVRNTF